MNWSNTWNTIWNDVVSFFKTNGWHIFGFFVALFLGIILVKILIRIFKGLLRKTKLELIAQNFIMVFVKFILYLIWLLVLLSLIGVNISGIITAFSACLLAIGLALESCIANVANGIIIVANKMFKNGDYISVGGVEGSIVGINFLFVTIVTTDNKRVTLPNSTIVNSAVINAGANDTRRVDFTFQVAYETDVELVKKIVTDVMVSNGNVRLDPAPFCRLKTLNSSSIDFFANCWCDREDYWDVYYYIIENVYNEFKRNNISIPYAQMEIRDRKDKVVMPVNKAKLPARVEKVRAKQDKIDLENDSLATILHKSKKQIDSKKDNKKQAKAERKQNKKNK